MRALHPCGTGCVGKRLTGCRYGEQKVHRRKNLTLHSRTLRPLLRSGEMQIGGVESETGTDRNFM